MKRIMLMLIMLSLMIAAGTAQEAGKNLQSIATLNDLFTKPPFWTAELSGGFGYRLENYFRSVTQIGGTTDIIVMPGMGITAKPYFFLIPRIKTGYANFYLTAAFYYDINENSLIMPAISTFGIGYLNQPPITTAGKLAETGLTFITDAFTYSNKLYMDIENAHGGAHLFFIENSLKLSIKNVKAHIATLSSWDGTLTNIAFDDTVMTNASILISDIFNCTSLLVGSNEFSYFRVASLFAPASIKERIIAFETKGMFGTPFVTQQLRKDGEFYYGMAGTYALTSVDGLMNVLSTWGLIPVITTISLQKPFKIPLTVYLYTPLDNETSLAEYFYRYNVTIGLMYEIPGIGTIDAGWVAGIGYTVPGIFQNFGPWYTPRRFHDSNVFYLDVKLNLSTLKELTVVTGMELLPSTFYNADRAGGTGTNADPYVLATVNSFAINYGLELTYQADKLLKNLSFGLGLYINYGTGKNFQNMEIITQNFSEYNALTFPSTGYVLLESYTEENYIQFMYYENRPLSLYCKAEYTLNSVKFSLENLFIKLRGKIDYNNGWWNVLALGAKRPLGFYDTDELRLAVTYTQDAFSFTAGFGYTFYLGLPSIGELGYTDAIAQTLGYYNATALYNSKAPDIIKHPWNIAVEYSLKY